MVFALGDDHYAAPVGRVREILRPVPTVRMPRVAPWVRGLFNLRGRVLPLVEAKRRLGLPGAPGEGSPGARVVVVETAGGDFGVGVDAVVEVLSCDAAARQRPRSLMEIPAARFIDSVLDLGGRLVFALDLDALVEGAAGA